MTLTESLVEDHALTWFGGLGYEVAQGPQLAPGEPTAERDSFGDVLLVGTPSLTQTNCASCRMLSNPAIAGLPKLLIVAGPESRLEAIS